MPRCCAQAAAAAAGAQQYPGRRTVRGGHADRQPGRPEPARDPRAGAGRRRGLRGHAPQRAAAAPPRARRKPLLAVHEHNEREAAEARDRAAGARRARRLRQRRRHAGDQRPGRARWSPRCAPPATACCRFPARAARVAALSVAGDAHGDGFRFAGFLPAKGGERAQALAQLLARAATTQVLFEAPHRIEALAARAGRGCGARPVTLCRELTKQFETVAHAGRRGAAGLAGGRREPAARRVRAGAACARRAADAAAAPQHDRALRIAAGGAAAEAGRRARRASSPARRATRSTSARWR